MYSPEIREDTQRIPPVFLGLAASWPLGDWHRHRKDVKVRPELVLNPVTYISWCSILSSGYWKFSQFKILLSVYVYFTGKKIFSKFPNLKLCYLIDKHFLMMKVTNCCGTGVNWADLCSVVAAPPAGHNTMSSHILAILLLLSLTTAVSQYGKGQSISFLA